MNQTTEQQRAAVVDFNGRKGVVRYHSRPESADYDTCGEVDVSEQIAGRTDRAPLPKYLDEVNHSPTGFAWGYHGSGPAQLAYAILRDFTGSKLWAKANYLRFKDDVIAALPREAWTLEGTRIDHWLAIDGRVPVNES